MLWRRMLILLLVLFGLSYVAAQDLPDEVVERLEGTVVRVIAVKDEGVLQRRTGTGFLYGENDYIVTAYHVVVGADRISVQKNDRVIVAEIERAVPEQDLVLLRIAEPITEALPLTSIPSSAVPRGEVFWSLGYPYDLLDPLSIVLDIRDSAPYTLGRGLDSDSYDQIEELGFPSLDIHVIQFESNLVPGYSGAPVVDIQGNLIGIANGGLKLGTTGIGWAIPSDALDALMSSGNPELQIGEEELNSIRTLFFESSAAPPPPPFNGIRIVIPDAALEIPEGIADRYSMQEDSQALLQILRSDLNEIVTAEDFKQFFSEDVEIFTEFESGIPNLSDNEMTVASRALEVKDIHDWSRASITPYIVIEYVGETCPPDYYDQITSNEQSGDCFQVRLQSYLDPRERVSREIQEISVLTNALIDNGNLLYIQGGITHANRSFLLGEFERRILLHLALYASVNIAMQFHSRDTAFNDAYSLLTNVEQFIDWRNNERGRELFLVLRGNLKMWEADRQLSKIDHATASPEDYSSVLETLETAMFHFDDADGVFAALTNQNKNEPHADSSLGIYDRAAAGMASASFLEYRIRLLRHENDCRTGTCAYLALCKAHQYQLTSMNYLSEPAARRLLGEDVQLRRYLTSLQIYVPLLTTDSACPTDGNNADQFPTPYEAAYRDALENIRVLAEEEQASYITPVIEPESYYWEGQYVCLVECRGLYGEERAQCIVPGIKAFSEAISRSTRPDRVKHYELGKTCCQNSSSDDQEMGRSCT